MTDNAAEKAVLVTGSCDNGINLWNVNTGICHRNRWIINSVSFSTIFISDWYTFYIIF